MKYQGIGKVRRETAGLSGTEKVKEKKKAEINLEEADNR